MEAFPKKQHVIHDSILDTEEYRTWFTQYRLLYFSEI
ncbi:hypothetical protein BAAM1489_05040 [Bifidobacterium animalis subsp. animalis MCC 1489]|nr:hypothetical protein BAAM1489_05040 [Bifidobacterium animalis subsp. animalis MCC 1489]